MLHVNPPKTNKITTFLLGFIYFAQRDETTVTRVTKTTSPEFEISITGHRPISRDSQAIKMAPSHEAPRVAYAN